VARATHPTINSQPFALHWLPIDFTVQSRSHHTVVTTTSCPLPIRRSYNSALAFAANVDENFIVCDRFHSRTICSTAFHPAPREHNNTPPSLQHPVRRRDRGLDVSQPLLFYRAAQRRVTITHESSSTHLTPSSGSCSSPLRPLIPLRHAHLVDGTSTTDPSDTTMTPSIKRRTMRPTHTCRLHVSINEELLHRVPVKRAPASSTVTSHCSSTSLMINSH